MSYIQSLNELEHLATLIKDTLDDCPFLGVDTRLSKERPVDIAYKMAITLQGTIVFPKSDRVYENVGKVDVTALSSTATNLGMAIIGGDNWTENERTTAFYVGYWLLLVLVNDKRIEFIKGRFANDEYKIYAKDPEFLDMLFYIVNTNPESIPIKTRPSYEQPKPFKSLRHPIGGDMVRAINPLARDYFTYDKCPEVFDAINKQMATPYKIDMDLLSIYRELKDDSLFTLSDKNLSEEQRDGILREREMVMQVAEGTKGRKFWEYAFYDYRGRIYSSAVWLTHQGSKLSKSLFRLAKTAPIGREGWTWMLCHAANCWGYDKDVMDGRYKFAEDRLDEWMVWAEDPVTNKGWKDADDPFCFLAAIREIYRAVSSGDKFEYRSGLIVAWDATCSGLQVLSSLGRSVEEGEFCNITQKEERGDYYNAIAEEVWKECTYTEEDKADLDRILAKMRKFNERIKDAEKDDRKAILDERRDYSKKVGKRLYELSKVYWAQPDKVKMKRKLCKRPCMTYFYSCRERTAAKQLKNDFASEPGFEDLNSQFCYWLCFKIIKACEKKMPMSTSLMDLMIDMGVAEYTKCHQYLYKGDPKSVAWLRKELGIEWMNDDEVGINPDYVPGGLDFSIVAPRTKFLFMQDYKLNATKQVRVPYKNKTLQLRFVTKINDKLDYAKIKSATSPNFVHMLDGEIAKAIMLDTNYDVSCIHDSFGVIPSNAGKLYEDIRQTFVDIFDTDLLDQLCVQKGYTSNIEFGELNIKDILDNEHAFS